MLPSPEAREQKITELSSHFANDHLSLEDLERRIERVYKATTLAELEEITADLTSIAATPMRSPEGRLAGRPSALPVTSTAPEKARILSIMGEARRQGRWLVPQRLEVVSVMSDTQIDLTQAEIPAGIVEIDMRAVWAACKVIVPPGMRVTNEMHAIMASVQSDADEAPAETHAPYTPTIRLRGMALMSEVKVVVRRREDPLSGPNNR